MISISLLDELKRPQTTTEIITKLYNQFGVRGLFTGLVPRVVKVAPACAIMIATFEYGKILFNRLDNFDSDFDEPPSLLNKEPSVNSTSSSSSSNLIPNVSKLKDGNVMNPGIYSVQSNQSEVL